MSGLSMDVLALFFRRMHALVTAGIPVHSALVSLSEEDNRVLRAAVERMCDRVHGGAPLSLAMREVDLFPGLCIQMVRAGELSGRLVYCLAALAQYLENSSRLRHKVMAAFTYPLLLLGLTLMILTVLAVYVFPRQADLASSLGAQMPWPTRVLTIAVETFFHPLSIVTMTVAGLVGTWVWLRVYRGERRLAIRHTLAGMALQLPIVGPVLEKISVSRLTWGLALMLEAGDTLGPRLSGLGSLAENAVIERRFRQFVGRVGDGLSLASACRETRVFPSLVEQMLRVGEEQGKLSQLLQRCAAMLQEDAEHSLTTMATLLEPAALLLMGSVVGAMVIASALPILSLVQKL